MNNFSQTSNEHLEKITSFAQLVKSQIKARQASCVSVSGPISSGQKEYLSFALNSLGLQNADIMVYASAAKNYEILDSRQDFPDRRDVREGNTRYHSPNAFIDGQNYTYQKCVISFYIQKPPLSHPLIPHFIANLFTPSSEGFITQVTVFDLDEELSVQSLEKVLTVNKDSVDNAAARIMSCIEARNFKHKYNEKPSSLFNDLFKFKELPSIIELVKNHDKDMYKCLLEHQDWQTSLLEKEALRKSVAQPLASEKTSPFKKI